MRVLKKVTEPQTIIICDLYQDFDRQPDAMVDDDETGFSIRVKGGKTKDVECFGFVHVLTKEEFLAYNESIDDPEDEEYYHMYVVLNDFVGEIGVTAINSKKEERDDFDLDDYLDHQFNYEDDEYYTLLIEISNNHDITPRNYMEALKLVTTGEKTEIEQKYLLMKDTYFVDPHGTWDHGGTEFEVVNSKPKYDPDKSYMYGEVYGDLDDEDNDVSDGYNLQLDTYDFKEITEDEAIEIKETLDRYAKLKATF